MFPSIWPNSRRCTTSPASWSVLPAAQEFSAARWLVHSPAAALRSPFSTSTLSPPSHWSTNSASTASRSRFTSATSSTATAFTKAAQDVVTQYGKIDCLVNGAGGNKAAATTGPDLKFFDLPADALRWVFDLNILGTMLPCQAFGKLMAEQGHGTILNISSMNSFRPLTRIPAYSGAKAAVSNFTQWLAVHMAQEYSPKIRVNAVAPGFFLTNQNRFLLTDKETGELTKRGNQIISHTPMARFGEPKDLFGAILWLLSPASEFVTGTVIPIDGGFSAYSGV